MICRHVLTTGEILVESPFSPEIAKCSGKQTKKYWKWPYSGFTHLKWWFSIVFLYVYQRVNVPKSSSKLVKSVPLRRKVQRPYQRLHRHLPRGPEARGAAWNQAVAGAIPTTMGISVYIYICIRHVGVYTYCTCVYVCMYVCMHACMHVCIYIERGNSSS